MAVALRPARASLAEMAAATPLARDRYVDLLRALSIAVVVFGHWLMAIVHFEDGRVSGANALDVIAGIWVLTWVLQVMPIFFFVGGFSNLVSLRAAYRRGQSRGEFIRSRTDRLMRPTVVFIAVWLVLALVVEQVFSLGPAVAHATALIAKPLWFLAVYMMVVSLAPFMLSLHERYGIRVLVALAVGTVVVDALRIGAGIELIGYLNFAFVWLFAHQLGFFYADGSLTKLSRATLMRGAAVAFTTLVVLTNFSVYSRSMVGITGDGVSNNDPPSVCLVALSVLLVSVAMLARPKASAWLQGERPWSRVIAANSMIMTVFLWHLTALLVAVVVAYPLGFPQYEGGTAAWWFSRPLWLAVLCICLLPLVLLLSRYERPRPQAKPRFAGSERAATVIGVTLLVIGMGGFAQGGFVGLVGTSGTDLGLFEANPLLSAFHLLIGLVLIRSGTRPAIACCSAALVGLAVLEAIPMAPRLLEMVPITAGNVALHLCAGLSLSLFVRDGKEERSVR